MQLAMIGLGRMGANMVRRLINGGHQCVVFDMSPNALNTWGPVEVDKHVVPPGGWQDPTVAG